jgi:signal transduction histidine kinase
MDNGASAARPRCHRDVTASPRFEAPVQVRTGARPRSRLGQASKIRSGTSCRSPPRFGQVPRANFLQERARGSLVGWTPVTDLDHEGRERLAAIGEIAAEVAHELRNVLQIISASAYVARQDPANSLPQIEKIERNARLAFSIVDDLMSLARGEAAATSPVLVAELVVAARAEIPPGAASWDDAISPSGLRVRAHPGLIVRVLHALYENAVHVCSPRSPSIMTRARGEGGRVIVEVSDDGPGVPAELAPRIFEPLVTGRKGGSGLGLAMAKRIMAAHGGTIALLPAEAGAGEAGAGARFRIELRGD